QRVTGELAGYLLPRGGIALLQPDAAGARLIGPEVREGPVQRGAVDVTRRERILLNGQVVGLDRPPGEPLAAELLGHLVLVEVEKRVHAVAGEPRHRAGDRAQGATGEDSRAGPHGCGTHPPRA